MIQNPEAGENVPQVVFVFPSIRFVASRVRYSEDLLAMLPPLAAAARLVPEGLPPRGPNTGPLCTLSFEGAGALERDEPPLRRGGGVGVAVGASVAVFVGVGELVTRAVAVGVVGEPVGDVVDVLVGDAEGEVGAAICVGVDVLLRVAVAVFVEVAALVGVAVGLLSSASTAA
ncbi:MAG TPA: hypothetical protein VHS06_12430 [Chloroflexota bacterium]|nr:hypothetical protein [Chloroflexota bacterium]